MKITRFDVVAMEFFVFNTATLAMTVRANTAPPGFYVPAVVIMATLLTIACWFGTNAISSFRKEHANQA